VNDTPCRIIVELEVIPISDPQTRMGQEGRNWFWLSPFEPDHTEVFRNDFLLCVSPKFATQHHVFSPHAHSNASSAQLPQPSNVHIYWTHFWSKDPQKFLNNRNIFFWCYRPFWPTEHRWVLDHFWSNGTWSLGYYIWLWCFISQEGVLRIEEKTTGCTI